MESGQVAQLREGPEPEQSFTGYRAFGLGIDPLPGAEDEERFTGDPGDLGGTVFVEPGGPVTGMDRVPTPDRKIIDEEPATWNERLGQPSEERRDLLVVVEKREGVAQTEGEIEGAAAIPVGLGIEKILDQELDPPGLVPLRSGEDRGIIIHSKEPAPRTSRQRTRQSADAGAEVDHP